MLIRNFFQNKDNKENYTSDSNILSINILDNNKKNVDQVIGKLKKDFKYLKLKSANVENKTSNYIFWFELDGINLQTLLKKISKISDENINISIYSKSGAFE